MTQELSYGVIPLRRIHQQWEVLMIQLHAGHWGFPKGHAEENEAPLAAAKRELTEETGLQLQRILQEVPLEEQYHFLRQGTRVDKRVFYYVAEVSGKPEMQLAEIKALRWIPVTEAESLATYPQLKQLCRDLLTLIY